MLQFVVLICHFVMDLQNLSAPTHPATHIHTHTPTHTHTATRNMFLATMKCFRPVICSNCFEFQSLEFDDLFFFNRMSRDSGFGLVILLCVSRLSETKTYKFIALLADGGSRVVAGWAGWVVGGGWCRVVCMWCSVWVGGAVW